MDGLTESIEQLMKTIQKEMLERAREEYMKHIVVVTKWEEVGPALDGKNVLVMPWCEVEECEDDIKERSGRA